MSTSPPSALRKPRVAVIFGGRSSEHSISCVTAAGVLGAIDRDAYDVVPIGIAKNGRWVLMPDDIGPLQIRDGRLPEVPDADHQVTLPLVTGQREMHLIAKGRETESLGDIDVAFPLLHGPFGEDGTIQGLFELADVRYVGCGVLSSAMMMDKHYMKVAFQAAGLPVGPYEAITDRQWLADADAVIERVSRLEFPVFVKPSRAGSSMGITRVTDPAGLVEAIVAAREHDPKVIVEAGIFGREIECAVLGGRGLDGPRASLPGEILMAGHEFYDFGAKYLSEADVTLACPADLPDDVTARVRRLAVEVFESASCEGLARVDFFVTDAGDVIVNEINTMPGFTPFSMFPTMWAASGMPYTQLITDLIEQAMERRVGLR